MSTNKYELGENMYTIEEYDKEKSNLFKQTACFN